MEAKRAFDDAFYERLKKRIANRFNTDPNRDECMFCPTPIEPGEQACTYCIEDLIPKEPNYQAIAYYKYSVALKKGLLRKGRCAFCGIKEGIVGHHEDYKRPLDVIWLCRSHHRQLHGCRNPLTIEAILKKHPKKKKDYKRMTIEESLLVLWGKNK